MCLPRWSRWNVVFFVVVMVCLFGASMAVCKKPLLNSPKKPEHHAGSSKDSRNLNNKENQTSPPNPLTDAIFSEVIGKMVKEEWQKLGIKDQVEEEFFAAERSFLKTRDAQTTISICLIKPGVRASKVRHFKLGEGNGSFQYTCVTAPVTVPVAVVSLVDLDEDKVSVQELFLHYTAKNGWQQLKEEKGGKPGIGKIKKANSGDCAKKLGKGGQRT